MLQAKLSKALLALVAAGLMAGCGANPSTPDTGYDPNMPASDPAPIYNPIQNPVTPGYGTVPTPAPVPVAPPMANVTKKKNGFFLGIGKFTCTVEVSNPADVAQSGTLTVTFMNGKKASKTQPITQRVTLQARETQSFNFEDKKWTTDSVTAEFVADPVQPSSPYGAMGTPGAMGTMGAAPGAATGGFPTSPYGY